MGLCAKRKENEVLRCKAQLIELEFSQRLGISCYAGVGYLSDQSKVGFQTCYPFKCDSNTISWRYTENALTMTSLNHAELFAINEKSQQCVLLSMAQHIEETCSLSSYVGTPTTLQRR